MAMFERRVRTKLNHELVADIRKRLKAGETPTDIAKSMNLNRQTVQNIKAGTAWRTIIPASVRRDST
jgi:DNA invertase Pin-like site-specific DNA recombinase